MKKLSKKILCCLLSVLMVVSIIPAFSITATADDDDYYLFSYFTGNEIFAQKLNFALSEDGLNFKALNGNKPIVMPEKTNANNSSGCARDPYIARAQDGSFYMIATDMDCNLGWDGDTCMYVWHSEDLINWTQITDIDVAAPGAFVDANGDPLASTANIDILDDVDDSTSYLRNFDFSTTIRAWAPQFIWDENEQAYMVYWSNYFSNGWRCAVVYSYTTDFITFTEPQLLYVAPNLDGVWQAAIDEDIIYNPNEDLYYMYYKAESADVQYICYVTSENVNGPYTRNPISVTDVDFSIEGANCHMVGDKLTMFADAFYNGYFVAFQSTDYKHFTQLNDNEFGINQLNPRHASVVKITKAEYDRMAETFGLSTDTDVTYNFTNPYTKSWWQWDTYKDSSGYDCIMRPGDGSITINRSTGFATLDRSYILINHDEPTAVNMLADDVYTISLDVILTDSNYKDAPILTLSRGNSESDTEDYFMLFGNGDVWLQESGASTDHWIGSTEIKEGVQYTFTLVSNGTTITLYKDGEYVCSENATIDFPASGERYVGLGWSYDHPWTLGCYAYSDVRFRDYALTASEVSAEHTEPQLIYRYNEGTDVYLDRYDVTKLSGRKQADSFEGCHASSAYTISAWVNPGETIDSNAALMEFDVGFKNNTEDNGKTYLTVLEDGNIYYCWGDGGNVHYIDLNTDGTRFSLTANEWQLLTIVVYPYANHDAVKVYVNNDLQYTSNAAGTNMEGTGYTMNFFLFNPHDIYLGKGNAYWTNTANSYIDDVRIYAGAWDGAALRSELYTEYMADVARDYVEANITNNLNSQYVNFSATAYHESNAATGGFSNVVYATMSTQWRTIGTSNDGDYAKIKHLKLKLPMPEKIVLVYDGVHDTALPIELETIVYKTGTWPNEKTYNPRMKTLWCSNGSFMLDHYWYGFLNGDYQSWAGATLNESNAEQKIGYGNGPDYDYDTEVQDNVNTTRFWWNRLNYVGTGDTTNYYETFNTEESNRIGFNLYSKDDSNDYSNEALYNENSVVYVLNYQPIYSILDEARQYYYNTVKGNEWKYTEESLDNYFLTLYEVMTCNPNNYTYDSDVSGTVQTCAADIKNAVELYNSINLEKIKYTVTYNLANTVANEIVEAGDYLANIPQNTAMASDYDNETHTSYSWPSNVTTSYMPLDNVTFYEIANTSACVDSNNDTVCDVCHQQLKVRADWSAFNAAKASLEAALAASNTTVRHNAQALEAVNTALQAITYYNLTAGEKHDILATVQDAVDAQTQAINNALAALQEDVAENDDVFVNFSRNLASLNTDAMYVSTVQDIVNDVEITTPVEVNGAEYNAYYYDNYITEYLTQMNTDANYIPYTVVVVDASETDLYVVDNGDGTYSYSDDEADASTFRYGESITLKNPNVDETSDYACSWAVSATPLSSNSGTEFKFMAYANEFTFTVRGDMAITTSGSRTGDNYRMIFKQSLSGTRTDKVLDVQYVEAGTSFTLKNATLPSAVAFYSMDKKPFSVSYDDGATVTAIDKAKYTPTGDCVIYVNYTATDVSNYLVRLLDENDNVLDSRNVAFNDSVTFAAPGAQAYVMYNNTDDLDDTNDTTSILCYGSTYSFYAYQDMDVYAVTSIDEVASVSVVKAPIIDADNEKVYLVGTFALPAGCEIQTYGFVLDGSNANHTGLTLADVNKAAFVVNLTSSSHTNVTQNGNQFSVKFNTLDGYKGTYVAYAIYTDANGYTQYAYSDVITNADFS